MLYNDLGTNGASRPTLTQRPAPAASPILHPLSAATPLVVKALEESYPAWTDENGTNVKQLAAIAVAALYEGGLLVAADPTLRPCRPVTHS